MNYNWRPPSAFVAMMLVVFIAACMILVIAT